MATPRDFHIDTFLTNLSVGYRPVGLVADQIFPIVPVTKQSNVIAQVDRAGWLRVNDTARAPKEREKRGSYSVSSLTYYCRNYAFGTEVSFEEIDNADPPHVPLQRASEFVKDQMLLDFETRVVSAVIGGVGSSTTLTGTDAWDSSNYGTSDPLTDIETAREAIRSTTGYKPNLCVIAEKTWLALRRHPDVVNAVFPGGGGGGTASTDKFADLIGVDRVVIPGAVKNTQTETSPDSFSFTDVWSTFFVLAHVTPRPGLMTPTFGYAIRWNGPNIGRTGPPNILIERKRDDDIKAEIVRGSYYQDERIVGSELGFLIVTGI